jgi:prepilin-type N-terminal cleavage/methylation domain-containing protein
MRKQKGFTLIELMIVVAIIGILAAVAIPKFAQMLEKAREGATKGNVGAIKSAVSIYYGDNTGAFPQSLTDASFKNYLAAIPPVKVTHSGVAFVLAGTATTVSVVTESPFVTIAANTDGWKYNSASGDVWVNNSQTDTKSAVYSMYGYE